MPVHPYPPWPLFNRSVVAAFECSLTPRAYGSFQNAPTLGIPRGLRVCTECNQSLGDTVDIGLARGSIEGALRAQRGLVDDDTLAKLSYDRIVLSLPSGHERAPMLLRFVPGVGGAKVGVAPLPQLRCRIDAEPLRCIPEKRIAVDLPKMLEVGRPSDIGIFWWAGDPTAPDRIRDRAIAAGLKDRDWTAIVDESGVAPAQIDVDFQFFIDALAARAVAKIAYEYFVWVVDDLAPRLVNADLLAPIREFVATGEGDWKKFVIPTNSPVLANETPTLRRTQGHLLTLDWDRRVGSPVIATVALFNDMVYKIRVCESPALIWEEIGLGHHFSIETKEVSKLTRGRFVRPLP